MNVRKLTSMRLVEKIVTLLRQRGLKQADLAAAIGVAPSRVTLWLQGTGVPNAYQLKAIATALNVPIDYLVDDSVNDPGEVRAGLTEKERLLLGAVGFIEGGIDEALHRMLNRRPATEPPPRPRNWSGGCVRRTARPGSWSNEK
jgi:transcriptional regulator with XRE-family HTH domain